MNKEEKYIDLEIAELAGLIIIQEVIEKFNDQIRDKFKAYGLLPKCRRCKYSCKQYNDPGLVKIICKKDKDEDPFKFRAEEIKILRGIK
jgi:hypothetical protein